MYKLLLSIMLFCIAFGCREKTKILHKYGEIPFGTYYLPEGGLVDGWSTDSCFVSIYENGDTVFSFPNKSIKTHRK